MYLKFIIIFLMLYSREKEKEKKKKKKKKQENSSNAENSATDKSVSTIEAEEKAEAKPFQVRSFPNGLVIEELSMGKPDGKKAAPGKKVRSPPWIFCHVKRKHLLAPSLLHDKKKNKLVTK